MQLVRESMRVLEEQAPDLWRLDRIVKEVLNKLRNYKGFAGLSLGFLLVFYGAYRHMMIPAKKLRHIKSVDAFGFWKAVLTGMPLDERKRRFSIPVLGSTGIYIMPDQFGFGVRVAEPVAFKTVLLKTNVYPKATFLGERDDGSLIAKWFGGASIATANGDVWKRHRRTANPAFHRSVPVKLFGRQMQDVITNIEESNYTVDVANLFKRFTLDVIGEAGFGFNFQAIKEPNNSWINAYNTVMENIFDPANFLFPWLDQLLYKISAKRRRIHGAVDTMNDLFNKVIDNKRKVIQEQGLGDEDADSEKDLLTMMLEANNDEHDHGLRLNDKELRSNVVLFFLAGHDTTSNALTYALYYMAIYPEIQERARKEALSVLGDEAHDVIPIIDQVKSSFPYISQVISETLRICPPAPDTLPRDTKEDLIINNTLIPKGAFVTLDIFSLHHNPAVWDDPERFDPDRFAPDGEYDQKHAGDGYMYAPFGQGSRICMGMQFSLAEQRVALAMLLRKFTFTLSPDNIHKDGLKLHSLVGVMIVDNMKLDFKPRY